MIPRRTVLGLSSLALASCGKPEPYFGRPIPPIGQTLVYEIGADPYSLDPASSLGGSESYLMAALFERLLSRDPHTLEPAAGLATHYKVNATLTEFTFYLRGHPNPSSTRLPEAGVPSRVPLANARGSETLILSRDREGAVVKNNGAPGAAFWSDGKPVVADDFVHAWRRLADPSCGGAYASSVFPIANAQQIAAGKLPPETLGVHAADDFTLRVRLKAPAAHFLKLVSSEALAPVPRRAVSSDRTSWTRAGQMPSCGPFLLHEWKPQDRIILRKNPHYYNAAGVRLDSIVFLPVRDGATGVNLYKTGNAHAMHGRAVPPLWIPALREKRDFHATQSLYNRLLAFNTTQPPFNNRLLRYAFNMATDKEEITRFLSGGQMPARTVVPSFGGYKCAEAVHIDADGRTWDILAYDPEAARALMKISGVETPVLNLTFPNRNRSKEIAQIIQKQWSRNLGAIVTLLMLEWNVWIQTILSLNYTGVIESGGGADYADPNSFFEFFTGRGDGSGWIDPEFNRLVDDANTVADPDERMRRLAACELRLLRAMPVLPLFFDTFCFLQKPFVRGLTPNILDVPQFKSAWIDTHWRPQ